MAQRDDNAKTAIETRDALFDGRMALLQSRKGYRFSIDALLLAYFVALRPGDRIVDLGTGNGIIPLVLARRHPSVTVTGIELQASMVERAGRNVRLNELDARIKIISGDVRTRRNFPVAAGADTVVCNPPYRKSGSGRISADDERQIARHETSGALGEFLGAAAFLLRNKGRLALIYAAVRCADLFFALRQARLEPKRMRLVHSFADAEAALLLVESVKAGRPGLTVERPLIIYRGKKEYSAEVAAMIAGSELNFPKRI
jgi:tRNA1Val (adenine37-N6)-methyltransferase